MILCLKQVLSLEELTLVRQALARAQFVDGRATAGWHAKMVKNNQQAERGDPQVQVARDVLAQALGKHELFTLASRPRAFAPVLFSRYDAGMSYGTHVDDALMGDIRSDLSFTVFLNDPNDYDGGELVIDQHHGEQAFKLDAGDAILYPSTTLHRVDPVQRGSRLVAVGWLQSRVRRAEQRELLLDLDTARLALFRRDGKTPEFDLLSKSVSNLLRMWAD
ncbi:MAG TPA: Fe2+-dependent dioxygenase [Burkholderiaceae bacterium]|nr:Fe2+-dependent dioxygenase [Burkholderiaceae bacterium]